MNISMEETTLCEIVQFVDIEILLFLFRQNIPFSATASETHVRVTIFTGQGHP